MQPSIDCVMWLLLIYNKNQACEARRNTKYTVWGEKDQPVKMILELSPVLKEITCLKTLQDPTQLSYLQKGKRKA